MRKQFVAMALVMMNAFGCMAAEPEEGDVAEANQAVTATCSVTCTLGPPMVFENCVSCFANQQEEFIECRRSDGVIVGGYCTQIVETPVTSDESSTSP